MKRAFISLLIGILLLIAPVQALAFDINNGGCTGDAANTIYCQQSNRGTSSDPVFGSRGILKNVLNLISLLSGVAAVILIMLGGFQYIIAAGDANRISQAKNYILYAIIGLVVTVISQSIIAFILNKL